MKYFFLHFWRMSEDIKKTRRILKNKDRDNFNLQLGLYIKQKREQNGLTQTQLAERIYDGEMEAKGIWKIENGIYTPNIYIINQIASVFKQSLSEFLVDFNPLG